MDRETLEWIAQHVPEYGALSADERSAIESFSFLWSYFEGTALGENGSVSAIRRLVTQLEKSGSLDRIDFSDYVDYLVNRYFPNGEYSYHFQHLHLERSGNPPEPIALLTDPETPKTVQLIGALTIVYRLRNNLFHGAKWQYYLRDQQSNFEWANTLLKSILEN